MRLSKLITPGLGRPKPAKAFIACGLSAAALLGSLPVHALDGCQVMLCLAAPKWQDIPMCVPTIRQLFHDLARGRPFPVCGMSGNGNSGSHQWAMAPDFCPPQYTHIAAGDAQMTYVCDYSGAVTVTLNGAPFSRTWWRSSGDSVTEFFPVAKRQLGTWDLRFETEYAAWLATQQLTSPSIDNQP